MVPTDRGIVLVAVATVALPANGVAAESFAEASAAAFIEARAEGALFLAGVSASTKESGSESNSSSADGTRVIDSWVKTHAASVTKARLTSGEPIECTRTDGCARVVVAWGLAQAAATDARLEEASLSSIAEAALAAPDIPRCDIRWLTDADGRQGVRMTVVIFPNAPLGPCTKRAVGGGCNCVSCRTKTLETKLLRMIAEWSQDGDVGVARTLTRVSRRTQTLAKDGTLALQRFSQRHVGKTTTVSAASSVEADFIRNSTVVYRHADARSVCVAFVPMHQEKR